MGGSFGLLRILIFYVCYKCHDGLATTLQHHGSNATAAG